MPSKAPPKPKPKTPATRKRNKRPTKGKIGQAKKPPKAPRIDLGRSLTIDMHPEKPAILKAIVSGRMTYTAIAKKWGLAKDCISRYVTVHLMERVAEAAEKAREKDGALYLAKMDQDEEKVRLLLQACHEWLLDPNKENAYTLDPRAAEIEVVYTAVNGNGNECKEKDSLDNLLARLEPNLGGGTILSVKMRQADPRELILKTVDSLNKSLELRAKIEQIITDRGPPINIGVQIGELKQIIVNATKDSPDIRALIIRGLEQANGSISS